MSKLPSTWTTRDGNIVTSAPPRTQARRHRRFRHQEILRRCRDLARLLAENFATRIREAQAEDVERDHHLLAIDCADCNRRLVASDGRCPKCGGLSWIPAGHVDRQELRRLCEEEEERRASIDQH